MCSRDCFRVIFHSTNKRSHWIKDNISNSNLNNSILLRNTNLDNTVAYCKKVSVTVTFVVEMTNGIFRSQSRAVLLFCKYQLKIVM